MSAIARMFLHDEKKVTGSDLSRSLITSELENNGAKIHFGEPMGELPADTDLVIYTIAIPAEHKEFVSAQAKKIPTMSYPEALGLLSRHKFTIAVAGSHGKTTTTAMIAKIMIDAGLDPTVIVGSLLKDPNGRGSNFIAGKSEYLVAEACEFKRSFLNLHPKIGVVLNIDDDHLDYYGNLAGVQQGFREFVDLIPEGGALVTDPNAENVRPVLQDIGVTVVDYQSVQEKISPGVPGEHNVRNARAALAVAAILGVPMEKAIKSLSEFSGTWRRFDYRGQLASGPAKGVEVYDDYAHHPTEISATLRAARETFPGRKITVAFQPHLYSRTREHFAEFGPALGLADQVLLLPIYAAREPSDPEVSSEKLAAKMQADGFNVKFIENFEAVAEFVQENLRGGPVGDIFFTMGAGDVNMIGEILLK